MQKLYAFNIYALNENFVASVPVGKDGSRREVYLAADVDALQRAYQANALVSGEVIEDRNKLVQALEQQLAMANDAAAKGEKARTEAAGMQDRIAELEHALQSASHARLTWAMGCPCKCQSCAELDDLLKDLMGT